MADFWPHSFFQGMIKFPRCLTVMSPIFGLPCGEIRRDFQSSCQPGHGSKIILLVDPEGFEEFYGSDWDHLPIFIKISCAQFDLGYAAFQRFL